MTSFWCVHVYLYICLTFILPTVTLTDTQPISAAVWDTAPEKLFNEFPVRTLVQFMNNHNLLQVIGAPDWLTIGGGRYAFGGALGKSIAVFINLELLQ